MCRGTGWWVTLDKWLIIPIALSVAMISCGHKLCMLLIDKITAQSTFDPAMLGAITGWFWPLILGTVPLIGLVIWESELSRHDPMQHALTTTIATIRSHTLAGSRVSLHTEQGHMKSTVSNQKPYQVHKSKAREQTESVAITKSKEDYVGERLAFIPSEAFPHMYARFTSVNLL